MTIQGEAASPPALVHARSQHASETGRSAVRDLRESRLCEGVVQTTSTHSDQRRSRPHPAKIDRFRVQSNAPSGAVTAVPPDHRGLAHLSQMSVKRVTATPVPDGGIEPGADTASLACSTLESSMSIPGNCTVGSLVVWKVCARFPNVGSTCGVSSAR